MGHHLFYRETNLLLDFEFLLDAVSFLRLHQQVFALPQTLPLSNLMTGLALFLQSALDLHVFE